MVMDGPLVAFMGEWGAEIFSVGVEEPEEVRRMTTWEETARSKLSSPLALPWSGGSPLAASQTSEDEDNAWIWRWHHKRPGPPPRTSPLGGGDLITSSR